MELLDAGITREAWRAYAVAALQTVERIACELGPERSLHLWPSKSLGSRTVQKQLAHLAGYAAWLQRYWNRVSEWPQREINGHE